MCGGPLDFAVNLKLLYKNKKKIHVRLLKKPLYHRTEISLLFFKLNIGN